MANSVSAPHHSKPSGMIRTVIAKACVWAGALFVTVAFTAIVTSHFTREDNLYLAQKNQELTQLERFAASGQNLDVSFRAFNDAIVDGKGIANAREKLRAAIAQNSSDTFAYEELIGGGRAKSYMAHLANFRQLVDASTSSANAIPMVQSGLDLVSERRTIIEKTRQNIALRPTKTRSWFWRLFPES